MIIFGFGGGRPKDRGAVVPMRCPNCGNENYFRHLSSTRWFSLFFIPLIPYSTKHFLLCPVCTQGRPLSREQAARAQEMTEWTGRFRAGSVSPDEYRERAAAFLAYLRPIDVGGVPPAVEAPATGVDGPTASPPPLPPPPPPVEGPAPAFSSAPIAACDDCGCPLPANAHFCPNCGARTG